MDIVLIPQQVVNLDAGQPDPAGVDRQLGDIEVIDAAAVDQFGTEGVVIPDGVDLMPGILGHVHHLGKALPAPHGQIAPADIQAGHQQIGSAGGLGQVDDIAHIAHIDPGTAQKQRTLGQAAARFVHRDGRHIRAGRHAAEGQGRPKIQVGAVRLIHQGQHSMAVGQLHQPAQVGADAVVCGVVDEDGHSIGVCLDGGPHIFHLHPQRNAQVGVHFGIDVDRYRPAQHQRIDGALVHVAGQDDLIPRLAGGQHHALHTAGGAAHHQKRMGCAKGVGGQLLCLLDDRNRMAKVIQRFHRIDIDPDAALSQKLYQLRVAAPSLVSRHVKGYYPLPSEPFQRLVDRRSFLTLPIQ